MADNREIIKSIPPEIFNKAMPDAGVSNQEITALISGLSQTCKSLHSFFKEKSLIKDRMLLTLCQAVIDNHREQAKNILNTMPELLWTQPPPLEWIIESKFTFQKFYAESPLFMAAKRKQIEMIKLMFTHYDKFLSTEKAGQEKAAALSVWPAYATQKNTKGEEEIVIPPDYAKLAKELIDVFSLETFPHEELSEKTNSALQVLFNTLLPDKAVRLDDYLDVELLLLALYKAYYDHFNTFQNFKQRDAFCIRVIGLVQSVVSPETATIICQGLDKVVTALMKGEEIQFSEQALKHLLKDGSAFYRSSRNSKEGLGFSFLCGIYAGSCIGSSGRVRLGGGRLWKSYVEQKLQTCRTYAARATESVSVVCDFMR